MKLAYEELDTLPVDATSLEKTNVLMKLRESLTDNDSNGTTGVIIPSGITVYPNNTLYFLWGTLSIVATTVFWTLFSISLGLKFETVQVQKKIVRKKIKK